LRREYPYLSLTALVAEIAAGRLAPRVVVQAALDRLRETDGDVRAFTACWPRWALRRARLVEHALDRGARLPLAGVPIALKAGSGATGPVTRRLLAAGAVAIGVTSVPVRAAHPWQTWGSTARGPTRNPWRPDLVPGGSSAGSAAAVACGVVPLATAADGAGSTRIPAAWCGVVGLKPTTGRLPGPDRAGLTVPGPIVRHAADALAWWNVVTATAGPPPPQPSPGRPSAVARPLSPGRPSSGLSLSAGGSAPDGLVGRGARAARRVPVPGLYPPLGYPPLGYPPLGYPPPDGGPLSDVLPLPGLGSSASGIPALGAEGAIAGLTAVWSSTLGFAEPDPDVVAVSRAAADRLATGGVLTWTDVPVRLCDPEAAWLARRAGEAGGRVASVRAHNERALAAVLDQVDLLLTPTTPNRPHPHAGPGEVRSVSLTWAVNLTGHPALSVPAGLTADGCPVGLQVIGRPGEEERLLRLAGVFEYLAPWPTLPPRGPSPTDGPRP